jgi:hypothetical protein
MYVVAERFHYYPISGISSADSVEADIQELGNDRFKLRAVR